MKKTVITKDIDGFNIVVGFGERSIEPMETKKVVAGVIGSTTEFIACRVKKDEVGAALKLAGEESKKSGKSKKGSKEETDAYSRSLVFHEQARGYQSELSELLPALKNKQKELTVENAVYFEPKAGETPKSEAEILVLRDLIETSKGVALVDIDGKIVPDNRGVVHCQLKSGKWSIVQINVLGVKVPASATLYSNLNADDKKAVDFQVEINLAAKLSPAEKLIAKENSDKLALSQAANMRSQLEIQGVSDALEQSQVFYQARQAELEVIYG